MVKWKISWIRKLLSQMKMEYPMNTPCGVRNTLLAVGSVVILKPSKTANNKKKGKWPTKKRYGKESQVDEDSWSQVERKGYKKHEDTLVNDKKVENAEVKGKSLLSNENDFLFVLFFFANISQYELPVRKLDTCYTWFGAQGANMNWIVGVEVPNPPHDDNAGIEACSASVLHLQKPDEKMEVVAAV